MRNWKRTIRSAVVAASTVVVLLLFTYTSVSAAGAGAVTYTQTFKDVTQMLPSANPCTGVPGMATITFNGVMHVTFLTSGKGAGTFWATDTETGTATLVPLDPTLPSYSGHFTIWDGDNHNLHNGAETAILEFHATGSDGSTLDVHMVQHFSISATGVITSFDQLICG